MTKKIWTAFLRLNTRSTQQRKRYYNIISKLNLNPFSLCQPNLLTYPRMFFFRWKCKVCVHQSDTETIKRKTTSNTHSQYCKWFLVISLNKNEMLAHKRTTKCILTRNEIKNENTKQENMKMSCFRVVQCTSVAHIYPIILRHWIRHNHKSEIVIIVEK